LSNCGPKSALTRYLDRHNKILELIVHWILTKLTNKAEVYCDLNIAGVKHISDLFNHVRPDLAIKRDKKIEILELTECHETNLLSSRDYK